MTTQALERLTERGQSVWLDDISRRLLDGGELERLIHESHVSGLTSNPTIFEHAISAGGDYDDAIQSLLQGGVTAPDELFWSLAIDDIRRAADALRPIHERSGGADGFVSLELPPALAADTAATVREAQALASRVDRRNLMVKVPATPEGIPAIRALIAAGVNVNVTLIFALSAYAAVIDAYLTGLEDRHARGLPLDVHSVASFFVSRVDTSVDRLLRERLAVDPGNARLEGLLGTAAIANARLAYGLFRESFADGARFLPLRSAGAHVQRPLWASTSAKDPNYRDVVYAEQLIGPDTVDTMPPLTIAAFADHGMVDGDTVMHDHAGARRVVDALLASGIDIDGVTADLLASGVRAFADSYERILQRIQGRADVLRGAARVGASPASRSAPS